MKLIVEFEWNEEELGPAWFNMDNLEALLFSPENTKRSLLKVKELDIQLAIFKLKKGEKNGKK